MVINTQKSVGSTMFGITRILPLLNLGNLFTNKALIAKSDDERIAKYSLLLPIARFYELPYFEIESPEIGSILLNSYYNVIRKLINEFGLGDESLFSYHANNLDSHSAKNKEQLLECLLQQQENPCRNDSRYRLGFRSIYVILCDNIDKIDVYYISDINSRLQPFFNTYKYKELLIIGLEMN